MSFKRAILVVEDVLRSRYLYEHLLHQRVVADFGEYNVGFEGGVAFYQKAMFQELIERQTLLNKSHNVVLYFEVERLDELEQDLRNHGCEFLHPIREQPWRQRVFRCYDYDHHILEIAEKMDDVFVRLSHEGLTINEISSATGGIPIEEIASHIAQDAAHDKSSDVS